MSVTKKSKLHKVYLGLGSNIAPRENIEKAISLLRKVVKVGALSTIWETPPARGAGPDFLNAVAVAYTSLTAEEFKYQVLRPIEAQLGRVRTENPYDPRSIDLDILIYDDQVLDEEVWQQAHHAVPLAELIPGYTHPESGEPLNRIAQRLAERTSIRPRTNALARQ